MREAAILDEIRANLRGIALFPRPMLQLPMKAVAFRRPTGYPMKERDLDLALHRLVERGNLLRITAQDKGSWYVLPEVWAAIPIESQNEILRSRVRARGSPGIVPTLVPGPAGIADEYANQIWARGKDPTERGLGLVNIRTPPDWELHPYSRLVVESDVKIVNLELGWGPPPRRSHKLRA